MGTETFIGENKLKGITTNEDGTILISFKDKDKDDVTMSKELFELCSRPTKNKGSVTDAIVHTLSSKFLMELADYGLKFYMVESVTQGMRTYAHNLRENGISKAFDCVGGDDMDLTKLID